MRKCNDFCIGMSDGMAIMVVSRAFIRENGLAMGISFRRHKSLTEVTYEI